VGKRHRRIRARSATGQVAGAATEKPGLNTPIVSMKVGVWSSRGFALAVRVRGRGGGGERRSSLYRPFGVGDRAEWELAPVAHFQREPSGG
jgi:hypothetical protein